MRDEAKYKVVYWMEVENPYFYKEGSVIFQNNDPKDLNLLRSILEHEEDFDLTDKAKLKGMIIAAPFTQIEIDEAIRFSFTGNEMRDRLNHKE